MIDELVLEQLLGELAEEIAVPDDGADRVVHELNASGRPARGATPQGMRLALAAAAVIVVVGIGVLAIGANHGSTTKVSDGLAVGGAGSTSGNPLVHGLTQKRAAKAKALPGENRGNTGLKGAQGITGAVGYSPQGNPGNPGPAGVTGPAGGQGDLGLIGPQGPSGAQGPTGAPGVSPQGGASTNNSGASAAKTFGAVDGAKIIKTGSLDLQVPKGTLSSQVIRMTHIAVGVGGYVTRSQSSLDPATATAQMTIRVPVDSFENAIKQIETAPGVKVLSDSENGFDVSAQYVNLQAKLNADAGERDSLLVLLSHTDNLGDILTVRDRITTVQGEIDQIQGQLNVLGDQSTYSSISVLMSEKPPKVAKPAAAHVAAPPTGLAKSWKDARQGFADSVEWLISRSGGALIVFLAALLALFALRYLYPVMRRALL